MTRTTLSSRVFSRNVGRAKQAADEGPVFIMGKREPAYVLISYDEYSRLTGEKWGLVDRLRMPGFDDVELDIPKREIDPRPPIEFD